MTVPLALCLQCLHCFGWSWFFEDKDVKIKDSEPNDGTHAVRLC